jgi:hypothetical protein
MGTGSLLTGDSAFLLPVVAAIMMAGGPLAALGQPRRVLAIWPTEALRAE